MILVYFDPMMDQKAGHNSPMIDNHKNTRHQYPVCEHASVRGRSLSCSDSRYASAITLRVMCYCPARALISMHAGRWPVTAGRRFPLACTEPSNGGGGGVRAGGRAAGRACARGMDIAPLTRFDNSIIKY